MLIFFLGKGEIIYNKGEYADAIYFIKSGSVSVVIDNHNDFEFMSVGKGNYFGEIDILFGETRQYTYTVEEDCKLLSLQKKHLVRIFLRDFKELGENMYKLAIMKRAELQRVKRW